MLLSSEGREVQKKFLGSESLEVQKNFFNPGLLAFHLMLPSFFFLLFRGE
jgi:hypothetical protein